VWNNSNPIDFTSASGNGFFFRADSYSCYVTASQYANIYSDFIGNGRLTVAGETIGEDDFALMFTTDIAATELEIEDGGQNYALSKATLTLWDTFPENASGAWTVKDGARVKLTGNVKLTSLTVEGSDVIIDLNGHTLKTKTLVVDGVKMKGDFNSDATSPKYLSILSGEGALEAGKVGLAIVIR
jgi:hypothetical protein